MLQEAIDMVAARTAGSTRTRAREIMKHGDAARRFADPSELAKVNLFLASDDASWSVTGSTDAVRDASASEGRRVRG